MSRGAADRIARRQIGRRRWRAELVGDDLDLVAGGGETDHRLDEILAMGAVEPGGAQDQVARRRLPNRRFPGRLALSVDADRRDRIVFAVSTRLGTVENIVGRNVNDRNAGLVRRFAEHLRSGGIGLPGGLRLAFGQINLGIGGRIDDQGGLQSRHDIADGRPVNDVNFVDVEADDLDLPRRRLRGEFPSQLAVSAKYKDHDARPSRSPR